MEGSSTTSNSTDVVIGRHSSTLDEFQNLICLKQLEERNVKLMQSLMDLYQKRSEENDRAQEEQEELIRMIQSSEDLDIHEKQQILEGLAALRITSPDK